MTSATVRPPRWEALDGLRAIGVVLVVFFHTNRLLPNGFLGVDVFFVLSGFLITTLLTGEVERRSHIDLPGFYRRRGLRLVPALVAVCLFVVLVALATGRQVVAIAEGALASVLYVSNIWLYSGHDTPLLQHTWTLALETQFYLVWPLLLPLVLRRRGLGPVLLGAYVLAAVVVPFSGTDPVVDTYVRAVGLPLGCGLALVLRGGRAERWRRALAPVAVPALLALVVLAALPTLPTADLVPAVLTLPVVTALVAPGRLTSVLSSAPFVWVGQRSYGLYLWHFPIVSLVLNHAPQSAPRAVQIPVAVVISVAVAAASYRWVEQPFLRRKRSATRESRGSQPSTPA
ncbi:acyltransferase [Rhodococcus antarcticus]|uniref:Acyltransferase n=1 Tax=Rhodococcus antarcticus TaxID=2987751 RepID=A0ABY6NZV7_9NOCA|nr:acyltransferase [Rhodococcus antarcticus]UZJ24954.1 acyltransferase [Rhodococcus antarcticus]